MTLVRWSPMGDLVSIQDEMNRLFNAFFARTPDRSKSGMLSWGPLVDISETEDAIEVMAEVPGMKKEDIKISIQDNVLTLKGEKKQEEKETRGKNFHRVERSYGFFERSFSLPVSLKTDKIKASYKEGILTITLPKSEEAKPKGISIFVG